DGVMGSRGSADADRGVAGDGAADRVGGGDGLAAGGIEGDGVGEGVHAGVAAAEGVVRRQQRLAVAAGQIHGARVAVGGVVVGVQIGRASCRGGAGGAAGGGGVDVKACQRSAEAGSADA